MRGNQKDRAPLYLRAGSIPACAGEPEVQLPWLCALWVYPRVCGGTSMSKSTLSEAQGLSPRVRGNQLGKQRIVLSNGSIPACAGEPPADTRPPVGLAVYPRVCGGTRYLYGPGRSTLGLSPRVRGNHPYAPNRLSWLGSIPACAGEPHQLYVGTGLTRVYPRVCGGTQKYTREQLCGLGLSPRVRGNRWQPRRAQHQSGSIPACAGEPSPRTLTDSARWVYPRVCGGTEARPWPA